MDFRSSPSQLISQAGRARVNSIIQHNKNVDNLLAQADDKVVQLKEEADTEANTKKIADALSSGVNSVHINRSVSDSKKFLEKFGGKKNPIAGVQELEEMKSAGESAKNIERSVTTAGAEIGEGLKSLAKGGQVVEEGLEALRGGEGAVKGFLKGGAAKLAEGIGEGTGAKLVSKGLGVANVAMGGYDLYEDIKTGHLQGNNALEKTSNVLAIGSGVADAIGLAFPPAAVVGAGLGILSGIFGGVGAKEEEEEKEKKAEETGEKLKKAVPKREAIGKIATSAIPVAAA